MEKGIELKMFERFQKEDLEKYKGKWIALTQEGVIAADPELKKALADFKKKRPEEEPMIFKVPEKFGLTIL